MAFPALFERHARNLANAPAIGDAYSAVGLLPGS